MIVNDAVNAGRDAILYREDIGAQSYGLLPIDAKLMADDAIRAAWPVLSAPLRELHKPTRQDGGEVCSRCISDEDWHVESAPWPCRTAEYYLQTDKELGLRGATW